MASVKPDAAQRRIENGSLVIEVGPQGETCLVRVAGELDLGTAGALGKELNRLLSSEVHAVVLDLEQLEFIDSAGLQCLVQATRRAQANGDRLRILAAGGEVARILELTGVDRVLPLIR